MSAQRTPDRRNRLAEPLDAVLHLLDRQVTDVEGAFVGKVDDLELTEHGDGRLELTGLLLGPAALVPRMGARHLGAVHRVWSDLARERADRDVPGWVSLDDVDRLGSEVELGRDHDGVIVPQPEARHGTRHRRVGELLDSAVLGPEGERLKEYVSDLRLRPGTPFPTVEALVVSRGRPGTFFGYDRSDVQGPVLLARAIRWLNRHTGQLSMTDVARIDWEERVVHAADRPGPLTPLD